ncbi:MAG: tetrathionate reductase family octaheme c-type cytochrome [Desulfobacterales bacterium]|nr:tetrathionate reductase family octaheme c-type cytochrome [Desulfobacterales bacterium]
MKNINRIRVPSILLAVMVGLVLWFSPALRASESAEDQAPGRIMAQQAIKERHLWNTTDHTKHKALQRPFASGREITDACLSCHSEAEAQFHKTIHWTWLATPGDKKYGKAGDSVNNFCISANAGADKGCYSCHPGWGNSTEEGLNCLNCHSSKLMNWDEAFTDMKGFREAGDEESMEINAEILAEVQASAQAIGRPTRKNCGACHFKGGGGDGVKHGDLDTSLTNPHKTLDVHMGAEGQNFDCVRCHTTTLHNIAGRIYTAPAYTDRKSLIEDDLIAKITCESCHSATPHKANSKANDHTDKVACQSCHIPEFARVNPTKMRWDWSKAGKTKDGKPFKRKGAFGKEDYLSIKGEMTWAKNVRPEYYWFNGALKSTTAVDMIDPGNVVKVAWPVGSREDANSRIFPFKVHRGKQPYDKVHNTLLAPLLSGPKGYWTTFDWQEALSLGQKALGLPYSGQFDFVETTYVFPTTHMVAPKENRVSCSECHARSGSRLANLAGFYMPGRDKLNLLDALGWIAVLGALLGVTLHGLGRIFANTANGSHKGEK